LADRRDENRVTILARRARRRLLELQRAFLAALAIFGGGCLFATVVEQEPPTDTALPTLTNLQVLFVQSGFDAADGVATRVAAVIERAFPGSSVTVLPRAGEPDREGSRSSEGVLNPDAIVIRGGRDFSCGTGDVLAILSATILPGAGSVPYGWTVARAGEPASTQTYRASERHWIWLPLAPFMPLNLAWRAFSGDSEERFLRALPALVTSAAGAR
jgi:hypothetical protein